VDRLQSNDGAECDRWIIADVPCALALYDGAGAMRACNRLAMALLGLAAEAAENGAAAPACPVTWLRDDLSPLPRREEPVERVLASGRPLVDEVIGVARPSRNDVAWLQVNADPQFGEDGRVAVVKVCLTDITRLRQSERAHQDDLAYLNSLDQVHRAILGARDLDDLMISVLDTVIEILGCDRSYLLYPCDPQAQSIRVPMERTRPAYPSTAKFGKAVPMDDRMAAVKRALLASEGPLKFGPDGDQPLPDDAFVRFGIQSMMAVAIHPKVGSPWEFGVHQCSHARAWKAGEERFMLEVGRRLGDALTGLLTQREQQESERRFRDLAENMPDFIVRCDTTGQGSYFNSAVHRLLKGLGLTPQDVDGTAPAFFLPPTQQAFRGSLLETLADGEPREIEGQLRDAEGRQRFHNVRFVAERDADGRISGALVIGRDVTEQRLAIDELERHRHHLEDLVAIRTRELALARDAAVAATRAKSQFLAHTSHEIRTPMNAIIGMTYLALQGPLDGPQRNYVQKAHTSAVSLLGIINDILDFSKIEADRLELETTGFDPHDVLDRVATLVGQAADDKGLELIFDVPPDLPHRLIGDPLRLGQVLLNLANNAVKFTETGDVVIAVAWSAHGAAAVRVRFEVRDTGIGIDADAMTQLFEPFVQADAATSRRFGGTGLGLAISRRIVELMGGELTAESATGRGSRFHFELELPRHGVADAPAGDLATDELRGAHVLVVDGHRSARDILCKTAKALGLRAEAAADGDTALRMAAGAEAGGDPFGAVLLDGRLPHPGAVTCAEELSRACPGGTPPLVLMATPYRREKLLLDMARHDLQVAATLAKPVAPAALRMACATALGLRTGHAPRDELRDELHPNYRSRLAGARVLLVEDNPINEEVARELLGLAGIEVHAAGNGREALEALDRQSFDAVLMDCQMPVLDGYEATRELRRNARWRDLPVIAMTANALVGERARALDAGMNDHLAKPIEVETLFKTLARWIRPAAAPPTPTPADNGPPDAPALDTEALLSQLRDDRQLLLRLLRLFVERERDFGARFRRALAAGDMSSARRFAHDLKANARTLGAMGLGATAQALESAVREDTDHARLDPLLEAAEQALEVVMARIRTGWTDAKAS